MPDISFIHYDNKVENLSIYRIITIERFVEMLKWKRNCFVIPALWEDPFEQFFSKVEVRDSNGRIHLNPNIWGQCWSYSKKETDAMWRIYAPGKNGVRIKTSVEKFVSSLIQSNEIKRLDDRVNLDNQDINPETELESGISVYCGRVKYKSTKDFMNPNTLRVSIENKFSLILFLKRLEFQHEKEFRFVLNYFNSYFLDKYIEQTFIYEFKFNELIEEIVFDPRMESDLYEVYRKFAIEQGFTGKIKQSKLYRIPQKVIRLP